MSPAPFFSSKQSEDRWVENVGRSYTINLGTHPCVFEVPQTLRDTKPEAYTPQTLGLGPYHHLLPEVQQMECIKRKAVEAYLKVSDFQELINFVKELQENFGKHEDKSQSSDKNEGKPECSNKKEDKSQSRDKNMAKFQRSIVSFYDRYLDLDNETLAWIVVIDGIFLLHLLENKSKWGNQRLFADIMMLENQIPFEVLKEIRKELSGKFPGPGQAIDVLNYSHSFCEKQSPLKLDATSSTGDAVLEKHILHLLYKRIVDNYNDSPGGDRDKPSACCQVDTDDLRWAISIAGKFLKQMLNSFSDGLDHANSRGLKITGLSEKVFKLLQQAKKTTDLYDNSDKNDNSVPLADKIDVPSASQLHQIAKIKFARINGGIRNVEFNGTTNKLSLPEITLCESSEVVLRNLLAYEAASHMEGSISKLELAEYVDLMSGLIDAEIDVELLRESNIIKGSLPNKEIVRFFNGINKSTQGPFSITNEKIVCIFKEINESTKEPSNNRNAETVHIFNEINKSTRVINNEGGNLPNEEIVRIFRRINESTKGLSKVENAEAVRIFTGINKSTQFNTKEGSLPNEEIVSIFNGINKSTQGPFNNMNEETVRIFKGINKATQIQRNIAKELKQKFEDSPITKANKVIDKSFAGLGTWIKRLFPILVLMLLALQSFCEIYGCSSHRLGRAAVPAAPSFSLDSESEAAKVMMPRKVLGYGYDHALL